MALKVTSASFGWRSPCLGKHCTPRQLIHIIVILVMLTIVIELYFHYTWSVPKQWSMTVLPTTRISVRGSAAATNMAELLNETDREKEQHIMESEFSAIKRAVQDKMLFHERHFVNPHHFKYIHNVQNACQGTKVELLIGVPSRTDSFEVRRAIRETWGQPRENPVNRTVTVFLLGATTEDHVQSEIDKESLEYGDIIQEDFLDSYKNLSLKSVALFKWVSVYCPNSTFVLKADEDMYINVPLLLSALQEYYRWSRLFIMGRLNADGSPIRNINSKYYVSYEEYPYNLYPSFVSGTAYAMTTTAAMKLYMESFYVPRITLEDVYLTGVVADRVAIPKLLHRGFDPRKSSPRGCGYKERISGHDNNATEIRKIHEELWDEKSNCTIYILPRK